MTKPSAIRSAVAPLLNDALLSAEQRAEKKIASVYADMEANGWDVNKAAPYPKSFGAGREAYAKGKAKYSLYHLLTKSAKPSYRIDEPDLRERNPAGAAKFIADTRAYAAASYEAFIVKLEGKVGEVKSATLSGNHVWGHSILTVTRKDGTVERWKTQTILNWSVLGLPFNQWPTRKVK